MRQFIASLEAISEYSGRAVAWLNVALVLLIVYDVLMRYVFNTTYTFIYELEWYLFAYVFLLGAAYAFKHDRHVRVDLFYANFKPRGKALVEVLGTAVFLIPFCLLLILTSWKFTANSLVQGEGSPDPGGIPYRFLIKGAIPLGALLLLLQGIAHLLRHGLILAGRSDLLDKKS